MSLLILQGETLYLNGNDVLAFEESIQMHFPGEGFVVVQPQAEVCFQSGK